MAAPGLRDAAEALHLRLEDLLRQPLNRDAAQFPDRLDLGNMELPFEYRFEPGAEADGVTLVVPVAVLNQVTEGRASWLVPGLVQERIVALLRSLPKTLRKHFVPAPDFAERCRRNLAPGETPLVQALGAELKRLTGVHVPEDAWDEDALPEFLHLRFRLVDDEGQTLGAGRDLGRLGMCERSRSRRGLGRAFRNCSFTGTGASPGSRAPTSASRAFRRARTSLIWCGGSWTPSWTPRFRPTAEFANWTTVDSDETSAFISSSLSTNQAHADSFDMSLASVPTDGPPKGRKILTANLSRDSRHELVYGADWYGLIERAEWVLPSLVVRAAVIPANDYFLSNYATTDVHGGFPWAPMAAMTLGVVGGTGPTITRSYVYTRVSESGVESPPSPAVSASGNRVGTWQRTNITAWGGTTDMLTGHVKRIYRTPEGSSVYRFVAEIAGATTTANDTAADRALGEELTTAQHPTLQYTGTVATGATSAMTSARMPICCTSR